MGDELEKEVWPVPVAVEDDPGIEDYIIPEIEEAELEEAEVVFRAALPELPLQDELDFLSEDDLIRSDDMPEEELNNEFEAWLRDNLAMFSAYQQRRYRILLRLLDEARAAFSPVGFRWSDRRLRAGWNYVDSPQWRERLGEIDNKDWLEIEMLYGKK
jgi:hypothetical protein